MRMICKQCKCRLKCYNIFKMKNRKAICVRCYMDNGEIGYRVINLYDIAKVQTYGEQRLCNIVLGGGKGTIKTLVSFGEYNYFIKDYIICLGYAVK